ncbi:hypothetical protein Q9L58_010537 [Maublancomyces gigas]|uniref:Uncharacterized protein n=1 Tax=Discina gigas TaxID=1032678 RepID=A0ABR3G429_9PEZI
MGSSAPSPPASEVRSGMFTVTEFLAVNDNPPLASYFRLCPFTSLASFPSSEVNTCPGPGYNHLRVAHSSSRNNGKYEPIHPETLKPISTDHIEKFRKYITSMSPHVAFGSAHRTPFDECALINEADVTAFVTMT